MTCRGTPGDGRQEPGASSSSAAARSPASSRRRRAACPASTSPASRPTSTTGPAGSRRPSAAGSASPRRRLRADLRRLRRLRHRRPARSRPRRREGVERLPGAHCYELFAGSAAFEAMADAEPGTFWLTDFLARNFERLVIRGLGIDRHPELQATYFAHYTPGRVPLPDRRPRPPRDGPRAADRLGLAFEHRPTGTSATSPRRSRSGRRTAAAPLMASLDRDLVARHPRPGARPRRPPGQQGPAPPAVPGRDRQGRQPRRQARLQRLHRGVAEGRPRLRRRPRGRGRRPSRTGSRPNTTSTASRP